MKIKKVEFEEVPHDYIECIECHEIKWMPVGEYDICVDCYFRLHEVAGKHRDK